jgi:Zn-dependent protease
VVVIEWTLWAVVPLLFAVTLHEAAHGYVARWFGDPTAEIEGRLTLNPLKHIDPLGTLFFPAMSFYLIAVPVGWAKSVPVWPGFMENPRRDMVWVALAGPAINLVQAGLWGALGMLIAIMTGEVGEWTKMITLGVWVNLAFAAFNLLPVLPLDGGRVAVNLLPKGSLLQRLLLRMEPFGMGVVVVVFIGGNALWRWWSES